MAPPPMNTLSGVFRYVPHRHLLLRLAQGWRWCADLGPVHGEWCSLMWWCDGSCRDGEAP